MQEENEIPSSVFVKEPAPLPEVEEETPAIDANRSQEEGLHTIALSSDEEQGPEEDDDEILRVLDLEDETRVEKSRAEKIKRSSLKKVDSLKKAFSRQNIEKKMNKFSTKIVSQEKRDKIKKSLSPNHQKNPSAKSSSFKVSPLTFNIKKNRSGDGEAEAEAEAQSEGSPSAVASIELAPIESPTDLSFKEVHSQLAPGQEEVKAAVEAMEKDEVPSILNGTAEVELSITEDVSEEYALSATLPQDASQIEVSHKALREEDEEEEKERVESEESPLAEAAGQAEGVAVGQAS